MRRIIGLLAILTLIILATLSVAMLKNVSKPSNSNLIVLSKNNQEITQSTMPTFSLTSLTGSSLSSASMVYPLVLTFFASWCSECQKDLSTISSWQSNMPKSDHIYGIDEGDDRTKAINLVNSYGLKFPVGYDPDETLIFKYFHLFGLPATIVVSSKHKIVAQYIGAVDLATLKHLSSKLT